MFEIPSTIVRKMMGPITIFTSLTKVSPIGRRERPRAGSSAPTAAPSATAQRTWNVRLRASRFMRPRASGLPGQEERGPQSQQHGQEQAAEEQTQGPEG